MTVTIRCPRNLPCVLRSIALLRDTMPFTCIIKTWTRKVCRIIAYAALCLSSPITRGKKDLNIIMETQKGSSKRFKFFYWLRKLLWLQVERAKDAVASRAAIFLRMRLNLDFFQVCRVVLGLGFTWTPKVCKIMAFMAVMVGLGLLFHILLGFR